ncbi:CopG family transcriptional regulator [Bacillus pseudomycoides]|uniref:CopG family transcriptional regulator n=1 Tax=Bacillus pseudomycoides TaxID=64104 RepID=UPI000BF1DDA4|nr:CopG family transcriptional regulator [Bacillus pseudomycoides]PEI44617.1 CopG family transcriptional regulator [Bacillus pseudomycoides]PFY13887.1 CopG family transcriptional regulator [Bacillus pseudomycoides]
MQKHGGKREGAGRPSLGITKKVSITLSEEDWKRIEDSKKSFSQFFREVTLKEFEK